jgi:hypothetical protein
MNVMVEAFDVTVLVNASCTVPVKTQVIVGSMLVGQPVKTNLLAGPGPVTEKVELVAWSKPRDVAVRK